MCIHSRTSSHLLFCYFIFTSFERYRLFIHFYRLSLCIRLLVPIHSHCYVIICLAQNLTTKFDKHIRNICEKKSTIKNVVLLRIYARVMVMAWIMFRWSFYRKHLMDSTFICYVFLLQLILCRYIFYPDWKWIKVNGVEIMQRRFTIQSMDYFSFNEKIQDRILMRFGWPVKSTHMKIGVHSHQNRC